MPSIEYSPTDRATCRGCFQKIRAGTVRVGVRRSSESGRRGGRGGCHRTFQDEYYHAKCYTGRKDFTKFYGWHSLECADKHELGPPIESSATPIDKLNVNWPLSKRWKVVAQVTAKSDLHEFHNARSASKGKVFHLELIDDSGVDIRATFFGEAADKFHPFCHVGQTYEFADGKLRAANPKFNTCQSPLEVTFDEHSHIVPCSQQQQQQQGAAAPVVVLPYQFVKLEHVLQNAQHGEVLDVLAVVQNVGELQTVSREIDGKQVPMRRICLVDDTSLDIVPWTLWEEAATARSPPAVGNVVALRHTRISHYKGQVCLRGAAGWQVVAMTIAEEEQQRKNLSAQVQNLEAWWKANHLVETPEKVKPTTPTTATATSPQEEETMTTPNLTSSDKKMDRKRQHDQDNVPTPTKCAKSTTTTYDY